MTETQTPTEAYLELSARLAEVLRRGDSGPEWADLQTQLSALWEQMGAADRAACTAGFAKATETRAEILDPETPCLAGEWAEAVVRATAEAEGSVVSEGGQVGDEGDG